MEHLTTLAGRIRSAHARTQYGRTEWIEGTIDLAKLLSQARKQFKADVEFSHWVVDARLEDINHQDRAALIAMAADIDLARIILEETTRTSWQHIWNEEMKVRFTQASKPALQKKEIEKGQNTAQIPEETSIAARIETTNQPKKVEPAQPLKSGSIEKIIGDEHASYIRAWYTISQKGDLARGIAKVKSEKQTLIAIAEAVETGECRHAPVAGANDFDIRMVFPHIPEIVAKQKGCGRTVATLKKKVNGVSDWDRFAELNEICKAKSDYCHETPGPRGKTYRLRTPDQERELGQAAWRWWESKGVWPGDHPKLQVYDNPERVEVKPSAEAIYFGKTLWPPDACEFTFSEERTPTKDDLENTYWFVEELHRAMTAGGTSHTAVARYLRNWSKYIERLQKPVAVAQLMRVMAEGLDRHAAAPDRNLDLQNKIPSRPLKFAQEA
jgi:hypothetical protein